MVASTDAPPFLQKTSACTRGGPPRIAGVRQSSGRQSSGAATDGRQASIDGSNRGWLPPSRAWSSAGSTHAPCAGKRPPPRRQLQPGTRPRRRDARSSWPRSTPTRTAPGHWTGNAITATSPTSPPTNPAGSCPTSHPASCGRPSRQALKVGRHRLVHAARRRGHDEVAQLVSRWIHPADDAPGCRLSSPSLSSPLSWLSYSGLVRKALPGSRPCRI
jgi:hypothetical protein